MPHAEVKGGARKQRAPGEPLGRRCQQRRNDPQRHGKQQHAEELAHRHHPFAGPGQKRALGYADCDERQAHADGEREERRAAEHHVARARNLEQRSGERRGYAGAHDDRGEHAHRRHRGEAPALEPALARVEAIMQKPGKPQLVHTEH